MLSSHPVAVYSRRRDAELRAGTYVGQQPVEAIAGHVDQLIDGGMTMADIARRAGLSFNTVLQVRHRLTPSVRGGTAKALRSVPLLPRPKANHRSIIGSARRCQALVAIGYSLDSLGTHLGMPNGKHVGTIAREQRTCITDGLAREISRLYGRLADAPPPPTRYTAAAIALARRRSWVPPDAWDDATIDDPTAPPYSWQTALLDAVPDEVAVAWVVSGGRRWQSLTREADRLDVVRRLSALGLAPGGIAARVGTSTAVIRRLIRLAADAEAAA